MNTAIVTEEYYKDSYHGEQLPDGFFNANVDQAFEIINELCNFYFDNHSLDDLFDDIDRNHVKKAVCAEVEYLKEFGGTTELSRDNNNYTSMNVGNFSITNNAQPKTNASNLSIYSDKATRYLRPTGLLYRGCG